MFENLAEKLQAAFAKLQGNRKLTEADVDIALREVRIALLEADVNFRVVKDFIARIKERAIGEHILEGLNPLQQVIKVVHEELIRVLSGGDVEGAAKASALTLSPKPPTVIMLCGLQGAGKTTLAGKLANHLRKDGKAVVLVACDIQRPAAITQLEVVGKQVNTPVFTVPGADPIQVAREAVAWGAANRADVIILDTAGRLHVDDNLMDELRGVRDATNPSDILLVLDAMTGQDAVNVAKEFDAAIGVGGFVLTKVDGDSRGGAAISVRAVVGKPIKFIGVGEKMDAIEPFYPERMASRILGMGDVLSLIEKASAAVDEKQAKAMEKKLMAGKFDFEDFLEQMQQMKKLGPIEQLLKLLPGVAPAMKDIDFSQGEKQMGKFEAIVRAMTREERRRPEIINGSRRKRIAAGAGVTVQQVNETLKNFEQMRMMMKGFSTGKIPGMGQMPGIGPMGPMQTQVAKRKGASGKSGGKDNGPKFKMPFGRG